MFYLAWSSFILGRVNLANNYAQQAYKRALDSHHGNTIGYSLCFLSLFYIMTNTQDVAMKTIQTLSVGQKNKIVDLPIWVALSNFVQGYLNYVASTRLMDMLPPHLKIARYRCGVFSPVIDACVADMQGKSSIVDCLETLREALITYYDCEMMWYNAELHRRRGNAALKSATADFCSAESDFEHAVNLSRRQGARTFELRACLDLARLYCTTGREAEARHLLAPALAGFTETPELPEIGEAQRLLASLA